MTFRTIIFSLALVAGSFRSVPDPSSPEFALQRQLWVQNITREDLLEALLQLVISDCPRHDRRWRHVACLDAQETHSLSTIFRNHSHKKGDIRYWNQEAFVSCLSKQAPASSHATLAACSKTLYSCVRYYAWYPFSPTDQDILTLDALTRAMGFLSGREKRIFNNWAISLFELEVRTRTERMTYEDFFRSLASRTNQSGDASNGTVDVDAVDILAQIQPMLNYRTPVLTRHTLGEAAKRISSGKVHLDQITISKTTLLILLTFLIEMLDGIAEMDKQKSHFARKIEGLKQNVSEIQNHALLFDDINSATSYAFYDLQRALTICFGMLLKESEGQENRNWEKH